MLHAVCQYKIIISLYYYNIIFLYTIILLFYWIINYNDALWWIDCSQSIYMNV